MAGTSYKIITFGCQMNIADSGFLASILDSNGFKATDDESQADIMILNTCSVREKAETRVYGRISELSQYKKDNNGKKIVVVGCMAQRLGNKIIQKAPYVDIVLGTDRLFDLPQYLNNGHPDPIVQTEFGYENIEGVIPSRDSKFASYITISRGCNNFCAYCIVPYVRGRERSYSVEHLIKQVNGLVADGVVEVTLLGQNVNSYLDGESDFTDLAKKVAAETDIKRIRFMTSHPKDMSDKLIDMLAAEKKMMPHVHLPLQSGSNRILEKMGRKYSYEHYYSLVEKLQKAVPRIALSTDLIVGFPTETEEEYEMTLAAVKQVRYDSAFMFRYSPREGTKSAKMDDDVPEKEKIERLSKLIDLQKRIAYEKNQEEIGVVADVLVDDYSRRDKAVLKGKTEGNKTILFAGDGELIGSIKKVKIESADSWTLHGEVVK